MKALKTAHCKQVKMKSVHVLSTFKKLSFNCLTIIYVIHFNHYPTVSKFSHLQVKKKKRKRKKEVVICKVML